MSFVTHEVTQYFFWFTRITTNFSMLSFFTACGLHCWTVSYISWLFLVLKTAHYRVQCVFLPCAVRVRPPLVFSGPPKLHPRVFSVLFLLLFCLLPTAYTIQSKRETKKKHPLSGTHVYFQTIWICSRSSFFCDCARANDWVVLG